MFTTTYIVYKEYVNATFIKTLTPLCKSCETSGTNAFHFEFAKCPTVSLIAGHSPYDIKSCILVFS